MKNKLHTKFLSQAKEIECLNIKLALAKKELDSQQVTVNAYCNQLQVELAKRNTLLHVNEAYHFIMENLLSYKGGKLPSTFSMTGEFVTDAVFNELKVLFHDDGYSLTLKSGEYIVDDLNPMLPGEESF